MSYLLTYSSEKVACDTFFLEVVIDGNEIKTFFPQSEIKIC